jgi:hypothetical protein
MRHAKHPPADPDAATRRTAGAVVAAALALLLIPGVREAALAVIAGAVLAAGAAAGL